MAGTHCLSTEISGVLVLALVLFFPGCKGEDYSADGNGTIEAMEVDIAATQGGLLEELYVGEGMEVEEAAVLGRIDSEIIELRLRQAESRLRQAEAQRELLEEGSHPEDIRQTRAKVNQAAEQLDLARKEWERFRILYNEGSVTKQKYEAAETNYRVAVAAHDGAMGALEKMKNPARLQEIVSADEAVNQAAREVEILKRNLEDCTLTSPMRGVITEIYYEEGELLQPGRVLFTLRDPEKVHVTVYLPEPQLAQISLGEAAEIHIDGHGGEPFSGRISLISGEAEFTPKNVQTKEQRVKLVYAVKIDVVNRGGILKPGMPADVVLLPKDE